MSGDCNGELTRVDPTTIITHADQSDAAALDIDLDTMGSGVQAVFNELFDYGCWALDDLACGDLVDELTGKNSNHIPSRESELRAPALSVTGEPSGRRAHVSCVRSNACNCAAANLREAR